MCIRDRLYTSRILTGIQGHTLLRILQRLSLIKFTRVFLQQRNILAASSKLENAGDVVIAVSYTHLDVYKRQDYANRKRDGERLTGR